MASGSGSPRANSLLALLMLVMIGVPASLTLYTARVAPGIPLDVKDPSPYGYTVSLLLFVVPIGVIVFWLIPQERLRISKQSVVRTIAILFPLGAALDFFFAHSFFTFPNPGATLRITAPALGGGVPIEEYLFYFTGFLAVLLLYIWLDDYWLSAYSIAVDSGERTNFQRLLRIHPPSLIVAAILVAAVILYRRAFVPDPGFPGYSVVLLAGALTPSAILFPSAQPVINWRALALTMFFILLLSLLWEATLGVPYGWWGFQHTQMVGIYVTAWSGLPVEEVCVWIAVTYATIIVYEVVRRWKSSGRRLRHAFLGPPHEAKATAATHGR
ncbi:MAG TPA: hypothetical protein VGJ21_24220 [Terracidiphilus sp.]|jgi:hypothetical protein